MHCSLLGRFLEHGLLKFEKKSPHDFPVERTDFPCREWSHSKLGGWTFHSHKFLTRQRKISEPENVKLTWVGEIGGPGLYCKRPRRGRRPLRAGRSWCRPWWRPWRSWSLWCCCTGRWLRTPWPHTLSRTRRCVWILQTKYKKGRHLIILIEILTCKFSMTLLTKMDDSVKSGAV